MKAKLSEYLRFVKAGETVLVTERDEVVAELRPAYRQSTGHFSIEDELEKMAERGEATLRSEEIRGWRGPRVKVRLKGVSSREILNSLREESS